MSLTVEDGTGVASAESYATVAFITTFWAARPQNALSATWDAADLAEKEGAAREASAFIDATWGPSFRGERRGWVQGLAWPRSGALDNAGYPLPDLPPELKAATAEFAARALSATLFTEAKAGGGIIKRIKAGETEIEYATNGSVQKTYPAIEAGLTGILNTASAWAFA